MHPSVEHEFLTRKLADAEKIGVNVFLDRSNRCANFQVQKVIRIAQRYVTSWQGRTLCRGSASCFRRIIMLLTGIWFLEFGSAYIRCVGFFSERRLCMATNARMRVYKNSTHSIV